MIIPTGIITGATIVLPIVSDKSKIIEPKMQEEGNRNRWSPPIIILVICGATRHTNPIIPVKQMIPAVINVANIIETIRTLPTFTPKPFATSSPESIAFKSQEYFIRIRKEGIDIIIIINI